MQESRWGGLENPDIAKHAWRAPEMPSWAVKAGNA